jgi:hypothetical protein
LGLGGGARSVLIVGVVPEEGVSAGAFPVKGGCGLLEIGGHMIVGADIVLSAHGGTYISRIAHGDMHSALPVCGDALVLLLACGGGIVMLLGCGGALVVLFPCGGGVVVLLGCGGGVVGVFFLVCLG